MSLDIYIGEYHGNVTHNLNKMAMQIKVKDYPTAETLYDCLWMAKEHHIERACMLVPALIEALYQLHACPEGYKKYEPENGWGTYTWFVEFLEKTLLAALKYPHAEIEIDK